MDLTLHIWRQKGPQEPQIPSRQSCSKATGSSPRSASCSFRTSSISRNEACSVTPVTSYFTMRPKSAGLF